MNKKWIDQRNKINVLEQPLNIYEIHLGSWKTNKDGGFLKIRRNRRRFT
ncbi:1,4-alpha-glucan branching enzyme [Clostridium beijerinckii]|nr:hypothetical protein [Clostridium beijerinckii]NRZ13101.1 1,4-alpha-glucan branching enzyme [Clostridium beijerinckii]